MYDPLLNVRILSISWREKHGIRAYKSSEVLDSSSVFAVLKLLRSSTSHVALEGRFWTVLFGFSVYQAGNVRSNGSGALSETILRSSIRAVLAPGLT